MRELSIIGWSVDLSKLFLAYLTKESYLIVLELKQ